MNIDIEIYGKDHCPYCDMAVQHAQNIIANRGAGKYEYKKLGKDFQKEELFEKFPGARTFPQVRIDGRAIGGYTEFKEKYQ
jgi:glutaredoxin 3